MSGSSSGPVGGSGGKTTPEYCATFSGEAYVNNPDPTVLQSVNVGDVLEINISIVSGISVVAVCKNAQILGGLSNFSNRLEHCIDIGYEYEAEVLSIVGAMVRVRITPI